jgi:hypothetical protein
MEKLGDIQKCQDCGIDLTFVNKGKKVDQSYVLLSKAEAPSTEPDAEHAEISKMGDFEVKINSIAENTSLLQNPLCIDCLDKILSLLQEKIQKQESERKVYLESLKQIENEISKLGRKTQIHLFMYFLFII